MERPSCSLITGIIIVKMIILSKDTYRFNAIPQNSNDISHDTREYDLKTDTEALRTLDR